MNHLQDIYFGTKPADTSTWEQRKSVRAVMMDHEGKIAILYAKKYEFPKLPGGGVETGENLETALRRECKEELGTDIEILKELGSIMEYRELHHLQQESFGYLARAVGERMEPTFTAKEMNEGLEIKWLPMEEVLAMFDASTPDGYIPKFIQQREQLFLTEAEKRINQKKTAL